MHVGLNPVVGVPDEISGSGERHANQLAHSDFRRLDSSHWSLLTLVACLRRRLRAYVEDRMRLQGSSTVLGLDFRSVLRLPVIDKPIFGYTDTLPCICKPRLHR